LISKNWESTLISMKTEIELFCLVETNYQWGLGHWYRVSNFLNQTIDLHTVKKLIIISFGDFQPDFSEINSKENTHGEHFSNFESANEFLVSTPFKSSPKKEILPFLIIDINHQSNKHHKLEISQFKSWFYTIGFYNKTNNISDLTFSAHINPNYFNNQNTFKKSSSNTLYLLGPEFRIFSKEIVNSWQTCLDNYNQTETFNILIIAGNTDPQNRIPAILQILKSISEKDSFTFHIVIPNKQESLAINDGQFYQYSLPEITDDWDPFLNAPYNLVSSEETELGAATKPVNFYGNIKPAELIKLYPKIDAAITAAGGTFWELNSFRIPCLLIPGSSDESITARWLTKTTNSILLLESHEQFTSEHSAQVLNFLNEIKNNVSEFETTRSNQKISNHNQPPIANSLEKTQISEQGTTLIWRSIFNHYFKNINR
jgi:spore coat polysaccharide biosynthesis predicted glycosyltransferase SpsG